MCIFYCLGQHRDMWYCCFWYPVWSIGLFKYSFHFHCWIPCNERKQVSMESICVRFVYNAYIIRPGDTYILCACLGWKFQLEYQIYTINRWYIYIYMYIVVVAKLQRNNKRCKRILQNWKWKFWGNELIY